MSPGSEAAGAAEALRGFGGRAGGSPHPFRLGARRGEERADSGRPGPGFPPGPPAPAPGVSTRAGGADFPQEAGPWGSAAPARPLEDEPRIAPWRLRVAGQGGRVPLRLGLRQSRRGALGVNARGPSRGRGHPTRAAGGRSGRPRTSTNPLGQRGR